MNKVRAISAVLLFPVLAGAVGAGGIAAGSAQEDGLPSLTTELQADAIPSSLAMETEDGNSSDVNGAVQTSSFDAVNVTERTAAGASAAGPLTYVLGSYNAAGAEYLMVQYENCSLQNEYGFTITIWGNGTQNAGEGTYYLVQSPADEAGTARTISWGNFFQPASYSGWLKIPVSLFPGENWSAIGAINFNIDFPNQLRCRINIGEIGFLKEGVYTCAVRPSELTITQTNTNEAGTVVMENKQDCIAITRINAGNFSQRLLAADSGNPWDAAVDYSAILNKFDPDRHQGRTNITFLDGHSASRRLDEMPWGGSSQYRPLWKD